MALLEGAGPLGALRRILATGLTTVQTRLQLIGNEILIEKHRAIDTMVRVLMALFCFCMALALATTLLLVLMWDQRVAVLSVLALVFLAIAAWLVRSVKAASAQSEHPFAASVAELQEDLRQLKAAANGSQKPR